MFHLSLQSASIFLDYSVSACSLMAASLSLPSSLRLPSSTLFLFKQPTLLSAPITKSITFFPPSKYRLHRTQHSQLNSFQFNAVPNDGRSNPPPMGRESPELRRTLFPGGYKRSEIKIPSIVLQLSAEEVLNDGSVLGVVDNLVSKWVGIVVLAAGDGGGGKLYKAACLLKSVIRDRAYLLISERVDIASAVAAGGVVLSDQGLPAIVARNSMLDSKSETVLLPIVGRSVRSVDAAVSASNSEGADFLIFSTIMEELSVQQLQSISTSVKIPIFVASTDPLSLNKASSILQSGASGLIIRLEEFMLFSDETLTTLLCETIKTTSRRQDKLQSFANQQEVGGVTGVVKVDDAEVKFVKKEKRVLTEAIDVIQKAAPLMEEVSLLNDAVDQLDEPFLLVIVGEFNSGKSSVVNALLGGRFLKEGVIPTTNEITFLRYSELSSGGQQQCERHPDGQYICYLPAEILKEMIIVDTPGTNVILQRQQRLTEEFVPRADLLLFVISADRPLTESEVTFLRYTQQWKKNVVFILNKSDLYRNHVELEEGVKFVKENVCQLLNTENVMLYPVSARSALEAKLLSSEVGRVHEELVMTEQTITTRSFYEFEKFLYGLLDGSTPVGLERKKMKLETPIRIAERLLSSCQTLVTQECRYANQELTTLSNLIDGVKEYAKKMESDSLSWRKNILSMIDATTGRATKLLDSTLQLSNVELGASLVIRGEKSSLSDAALTIQNDIVNPALSDAQKLLEEYESWLHENNAREGQQYKASFEKKWSHLIADHPDGMAKLDLNLLLRGEGDKLGVKAIEKLGNNDVSKLFEEEIREVFLGAFGGLGAAGLSASLLTSVLPTTMEDLLALGLCSLGGYVAISNFPARKQKTIEKVKKIGDTVRVDIEEAMLKDLRMTTERMESFVQQVGKPYQEAAQARVDKLLEIQDELTTVEKKLRSLQMELQNLRLS